jgi:CRP-like cAMP-binding protein
VFARHGQELGTAAWSALGQPARRRVVPGPLSQRRIAERVGASKAPINRVLTDLAKGGYIEVTRKRIVLLKKLPPNC